MPHSASPLTLQDRFFERFRGRTIILHRGFPPGYLAELLKQPGGGGHFRVDLRQLGSEVDSPMDWLLQRHVLPLDLPTPLLLKVEDETIYLRHLLQGSNPGHPSEILWMLDAIHERHHALLQRMPAGLQPRRGMAVDDNAIDYDLYNDA